MMKVLKVIALLLAAFYLVGLVLIAFFPSKGVVLIQNKSGQSIKSAHIEICHQRFELKNIASGEVKAVLYDIKGDSHYIITVELNSGTQLGAEDGYVTDGVGDVVDTFVVLPKHLRFQPQEIAPQLE